MDVHLLETLQNKTHLSNIKMFSNTYKSDHCDGIAEGKKGVL